MSGESKVETLVANVDLSSVRRKVWLVKVPKYLSERIRRAPPMEEIGAIKMSDDESQFFFNISQRMAETNDSDYEDCENLTHLPIEHKFFISKVDTQNMILFSHTDDMKKTQIEGTIAHKGELCPVVCDHYLNLYKERVKRMAEPKRTIKQLDRSVTVFKPITNVAPIKQKESPIKKFRKDRETVRNMLFELFEKHQYYRIKDLERLTRQPIHYLKEVMREMCLYNTKYPHQYMWQLRPEFVHYSKIRAKP